MVFPHTYRTEHSETRTTNADYGAYYAFLQSKKIRIQPTLLKLLQYVDSNRNTFIDNIAEAIKIKSVSGSLQYKDEVLNMIKFTENWMVKLGIKYECFNIGFHELDGKKTRLPPVILASLGSHARKKTLCIYTYLDVKEPDLRKWSFDPWTLVNEEKKVYGCGVGSGKNTLMSWFHMIQAFQDTKIQLPLNLKFIIESMYHCESEGLEDFLATRKQDFLHNIDYVVVCDSEWIGEKYPCLIYGTVGMLHFEVIVEKREESTTDPKEIVERPEDSKGIIEKQEDSPTDPKEDIETIFKAIYDEEGNILIPTFNDFVEQITPDEEKTYESIAEFDLEEIRGSLPPYMKDWDKTKILMNFWRLPSILVDDIQECTCEEKDTSIVKRHFVIKIVPRQVADKTTDLTIQHITSIMRKHKMTNQVFCDLVHSVRTWFENHRSDNYEAARRATIQIYKEDPSMIREDRPRLAITILDRLLERNILYMPLACKGATTKDHDVCMPKRNIYEGTKLLAAYLFQLDLITKGQNK